MQHFSARAVAAAIACSVLAACGGGGGDEGDNAAFTPPAPVAPGAYGGTLTGSASSAFQLLMLEGGEYWGMYGTQSSSSFVVAGFIQGSGSSNGSSFASGDARDFGYSPPAAGNVAAKYDNSAKTIAGTLTFGGSSVSFSGGPIAGSSYSYDTPASLATISGNWSLTASTGETVSLTISPSGSLTAVSSLRCSMSGTVAPRASGKNVYSVTLAFGAAPCALFGLTATGIAIAYPLANGRTQLILAGTSGTRSYGMAAFGVR